jgi:hypothetical protein
MAFDVYVGPLARYYSGRWENMGQEWARRNGAVYHTIKIDELATRETNLDVLRPEIVEWRTQLSEALGSNISEPLDWDELSDDYATARPDWDGWGSLVLWAAYEDHRDLKLPLRFTELSGDPAYRRSAARDAETHYPHLVRDVDIWLPSRFDFTFKATAPVGDNVTYGSTFTLLLNLQTLNERTWNADRATIESWGETAPPRDAPLEEAARYGFSDMLAMAEIACTRRMPMKLDY